MSENVKRILVAVFGIPVVLGSLYYGGVYFFTVVSIIALVGQREYYQMADAKGYSPDKIIGALLGGIILLVYYTDNTEYIIHAIMFSALIAFLSEIFSGKGSPMSNVSCLLFGIIYPVLMIGTLYPLRDRDMFSDTDGFSLVITLLLAVWATDTFAYYIGRSIGKHKLTERISPKKTWEGSIAGFIGAVLVMFSSKYIGFLSYSITLVDLIVLSVFAGIGSQLGDLFESLLKRDAGIKDSGKFLPGHGGMLDRFDAVIFAAPMTYLYLFIR